MGGGGRKKIASRPERRLILELALALGYASPARMLREMRPSELGEWTAFWLINPWGANRGDLQAGIVASTVANAFRDTRKRRKAFAAADFMPRFGRPKPAPTPRQAIESWFGDRIKRKDKGKP